MSPGCWLIVALGALFSGQALLHPLLTCPAVVLCLWLFRLQLRGWPRLLFLGTLGLSAWRAHLATTEYVRERRTVQHHMGPSDRCSGQGVIVQSPQWQRGQFVVVVQSEGLQCERTIEGRHRVRIVGGPDGLARGDEITFVAQLGITAPLSQLELMDSLPRATSRQIVASGGALSVECVRRGNGLASLIDRARAVVRRRILATYAPAASALGRALVLGENDLDPEDQLAFQKSGLSHLLAVSGTHLVFAVVSLVTGLRAVLLRIPLLSSRTDVRLWTSPIGALAALLYADFAGGSGSAWRAAFMLSAVYLATALKRRLRGLHALAYSILIGSVSDPWVGYDLSFLLSAGATAGLITLGSTWSRGIEGLKPKALRVILAPLMTTLSAMIPCVPLLLVMSPAITLAGVVANVIAGPIGEMMALPLCLLHAVASPLPWLEKGLALSGSGALLAVGFIAKLSAQLTFTQLALPPPTTAQYLCLGGTCLAYVTLAGPSKLLGAQSRNVRWWPLGLLVFGALSLLGLEAVARIVGSPQGELRVTAVDVGQGDAILVDLPDGRLMLIDGGGSVTGGVDPGRFILAPVLRARRRSRIDVVVLTHPHPDHYGGLLTLLPEVEVGEFWIAEAPEAPRPGNVLAELYAGLARRGTKMRHLPELCQSPALFGSAQVQILGPCPKVNLSHDANDQSIVLRISLGRRSVLLAGDAAFAEEGELVAKYGSGLRADLLKIGHHGSRSSTSKEWVASVKPAMAVVCVGARNRFGHPHPATLERLSRAHVPVYRTDQLGAIQWQTDGDRVSVTVARLGEESRGR